jgi:hypothetical protein
MRLEHLLGLAQYPGEQAKPICCLSIAQHMIDEKVDDIIARVVLNEVNMSVELFLLLEHRNVVCAHELSLHAFEGINI